MPSSFDFRGKSNFLRRTGRIRNAWNQIDFVLWGVPLDLVFLSTVLIASTQRQINYADWYQHLIIAFIGVFIARGLAQLHL